jgi:hypothetical protein
MGYEDEDTHGPIHDGPAYTTNNCTGFTVLRIADAYSVRRNFVYSGVRLPADHAFDVIHSLREGTRPHPAPE